MTAKNGLLVVSNPKQISKVLTAVNQKVKNTLYIQLLSALSEPITTFLPNIFTSVPRYSQTINGIYKQAVQDCQHLDIRVILSSLKYPNVSKIKTQKPIDLVIFDKTYNRKDIDSFLHSKVSNLTKECEVLTVDCGAFQDLNVEKIENEKVYRHTVMGGTYDRMHMAHKLLLSEVALRSNEKVTVGVTEEHMQHSKILWELIEPLEVRIKNVEEFLRDICPELEVHVVPINDPMGPTKDDPAMELLVVSEETVRGGTKINELRKSREMPLLDIIKVDLMEDPGPKEHEESKISSSSGRLRILGTLLRPVERNHKIPSKPYVIGLTGGVASGKSGVSGHLRNLGAEVIDCDKIGHSCYLPGKKCYKDIVDTFGSKVVGENQQINRPVLGGMVFGNPEKMDQLNQIVWPAILDEVKKAISECTKDIIVVEAAVLLQAGWENSCHEVWVSLVPPEEAVIRMMRRNLNEEQAKTRLSSLPSNKFYTNKAHVVFCSLWEVEYTKSQVVRAYEQLKFRFQQAVEA